MKKEMIFMVGVLMTFRLFAADPLIRMDFNNEFGAQSLVNRGTTVVTGTLIEGSTLTTNAAPGNGGGYSLNCPEVFGNSGCDMSGQSDTDGLTSLTLCAWIRLNGSSALTTQIFKDLEWLGPGQLNGFDLNLLSDRRLQLRVDNNQVITTAVIPTNVWTFVAVTYNGNLSADNVSIYAAEQGSALTLFHPVSTANSGPLEASSTELFIGGDGTSPRTHLYGDIDNARVYGSKTDGSGVLNLSELSTVMNEADLLTLDPPDPDFLLKEGFERSGGITTGSIGGQNGWDLRSGTADVQTNDVATGEQALAMDPLTIISRGIVSTGSELTASFNAILSAAPTDVPKYEMGRNASFYVNTNRNLTVWSNGVPVELAVQMPTNVWTGFEVICDFENFTWELAMDGTPVASGLPMDATAIPQQVKISTTAALGADDVHVQEVGSGVVDSDGDGLPDWWELEYFDSPTGAVATGSNMNAYIAGFDPHSGEEFTVAMSGEFDTLSWVSVSGRVYSVEWTSDLTIGFTPIATNILWPKDEFMDVEHQDQSTGFYRIFVRLENQ